MTSCSLQNLVETDSRCQQAAAFCHTHMTGEDGVTSRIQIGNMLAGTPTLSETCHPFIEFAAASDFAPKSGVAVAEFLDDPKDK